MSDFVNRHNELDFLNQQYNIEHSSLIVLYGRRRVGKTSLIREFIKDKEALYYLATEESININRQLFKNQVADYTSNALLREASIDRWEIIFEEIVKAKDKPIIIIDEFQYLGKNDPSFPSVFQKIWDNILENKNVMVILCGSLISLMMEQTLSYSSPLYGRRTGQIKLKQISFKHYQEFYDDLSFERLVELYSITGGVPKYIDIFRNSGDIYEDINHNILNKSSVLYEEPYFLLSKEVNEIGSYFSILRAIAAGNHKLGKISTFLEVKQSNLTRYLKVLMDLDILAREVPVTEKNPDKSKKGLYRFKDNYLLFWFKFVYPNRSRLEDGHITEVQSKIRANLVDGHIAYIYEDVCKEALWTIPEINKLGFQLDNIGRWWDKDLEIDLVALDDQNNSIIFGECKYLKKEIGISVLRELQNKSKHVQWGRENRNEIYVLFSINGFTADLIKYANKRADIILLQ